MPIYSRKAKYEELRKSLQNDSEAGMQTPELQPYKQRLENIAPGQIELPEAQTSETVSAVQPRRAATYQMEEPVPPAQPARREEPVQSPGFSNQYFQNGAYTKSFNNEYIDEFVQEAKKYNIDQGNAFSANTDLDILRNLKGERPQAPSKPYPDEDQPVTIKPISQNMNPEPARKPQTVSAPLPKDNDTADISFTGKPSKKAKSWDEDIFDDTGEFTDEDEYIDDDPRTMTKDDIAAEVRRMIDNQPKQDAGSSSRAYARKTVKENSNDDYYNRPTTERILNETSMIRSQMDDYEDNLNDVNDKMHRTNQILNIVLIILIIALALVLAVVVYWVLLSKGVIS